MAPDAGANRAVLRHVGGASGDPGTPLPLLVGGLTVGGLAAPGGSPIPASPMSRPPGYTAHRSRCSR